MFAVLAAAPRTARGAAFLDPLDTPAMPEMVPDQAPMLAVTRAGGKYVSAGPRGVILISRTGMDGTLAWTQAAVPVQSDLVAVQFPTANDGWACGYDGVVLHSTDGGRNWTKTLDGIAARTVFEAYYQARLATGGAAMTADLNDIQLNFDKGPTLPWLGIWFTDSRRGFVVGPFGDIAETEDGGKSWTPWLDHVDNPNFYNLNGITGIGGDVYIAGEQGLIYRLDQAQNKFVQLTTGYQGSFFGITGTPQALIAFGLRGSIYRSTDQGKTWTPLPALTTAAIMNGKVLPDGEIVLAAVDGKVMVSKDSGASFALVPGAPNLQLADITFYRPGEILAAGLEGIAYVNLK